MTIESKHDAAGTSIEEVYVNTAPSLVAVSIERTTQLSPHTDVVVFLPYLSCGVADPMHHSYIKLDWLKSDFCNS